MEFHIASERGRGPIEDLWAYCFEPLEHPFFQWYFNSCFRSENTLVGYENNSLAACVHLNPYQLFLRERTVPVSYIVGLATSPEARRGGVARQLLQAALAEMRRRKHYFNILMPSRAGFYYPFGWELCYHQLKYAINLDELRGLTSSEGQFTMVADGDQWELFQTVYRKFTAGRHGFAVRGEAEWRRLVSSHLAEKGHISILAYNGHPAAYIFYQLLDGKIVVSDMAYNSSQAQRSILNFFYNHRSQVSAAEFNAPFNDNLHLSLSNPKEGVSIYPFMAGRLVDVGGALQALGYPANVQANLTIAVADPLAEWNNHTFAVTVDNGQAQAVIIDSAEADIVCTIGGLSQLVFGRLSVQELIYEGKLSVQEDAKAHLLMQLFPKVENYINEYF